MTIKELKSYIDRVLGSSLRCLLPSYWWKRLFGLLVDKVGEVEKTVGNKQEKLVSGETIKTINGEDILGGGNIEIKNEQKVESVTFVVGFDENGNVHLDDDDLAHNKASYKAYVGNQGLRLQLSYYWWDGSKKIKYGNSCPDVAGFFNYVAQCGVGQIIFVNVNLGEALGAAVYGGSVNVGFGNTGEAAIEPYFTTTEMNYLYYGISGTGADALRNRNVQLRERLLKSNHSGIPICVVDNSTTGVLRTLPATFKKGIRGGETVVWISYEENGYRYTYLFEENGTLTEDDVTEIGGGVVDTELSADSSNAIANKTVTAALDGKQDKEEVYEIDLGESTFPTTFWVRLEEALIAYGKPQTGTVKLTGKIYSPFQNSDVIGYIPFEGSCSSDTFEWKDDGSLNKDRAWLELTDNGRVGRIDFGVHEDYMTLTIMKGGILVIGNAAIGSSYEILYNIFVVNEGSVADEFSVAYNDPSNIVQVLEKRKGSGVLFVTILHNGAIEEWRVVSRVENGTFRSVLELVNSIPISGGESVEEIYIGEEEPTDENVKVWINPNEQGGASGGKELIRSIAVSLDEDGNMFTTDADKSHNLKLVEDINNISIGGNVGNVPLILFIGNACTMALEPDEEALITFNTIQYPSIDESGNITAYLYKINILMDGDVDFTF